MMMYSVPDYGRYCLIAWCLISGLISLFGNLILLISSFVSNALKLDKVSVVLIQNLAVTGLGFTVFIILPTAGSTFSQRWIYGEGLCVVTTYVLYLLGFLSCYLIACLNVSKLTVLLFPLRARLRSRKWGLIISAILWALTIMMILIRVVLVKRDVTFSPLVFTCNFDYRFVPPTVFERVTTYTNLLVPLVIILVTALWLMLYIGRVRTLTRQSVLALFSVSTAYIFSYVPFIVFAATRKQPMTIENLRLYTVAGVATFLSPLSNPIIFYFTINSFRVYVNSRVSTVERRRTSSRISTSSRNGTSSRISTSSRRTSSRSTATGISSATVISSL